MSPDPGRPLQVPGTQHGGAVSTVSALQPAVSCFDHVDCYSRHGVAPAATAADRSQAKERRLWVGAVTLRDPLELDLGALMKTHAGMLSWRTSS